MKSAQHTKPATSGGCGGQTGEGGTVPDLGDSPSPDFPMQIW